jgi:glycosyltransferase involved in cell wall biosynthesis
LILFNLLAFLLLLITIANLKSVKKLTPDLITPNTNYDILVPMRNEQENVQPLITNLVNQGGKIYILNDGSTDQTSEKLASFANQVTILNGKELPDGWLGKNFACHQLAVASEKEYLVFIDADVRLEKGAINSALSYMQQVDWDFVSAYPKQEIAGVLGLLIQPLLQWSWFATVPMFIAKRFPSKSMAVANGQFLIIKRSAYLATGGHKSVKGEVLEDMELARLLIGANYKGGVADGSEIASCEMYKSDGELIDGYSKSLWRAFGSLFGSVVAILIALCLAIPFLYTTIGALYILISRLAVAYKVKSSFLSAFLHPIAMLALSLLIINSHKKHRQGTLQWKGRTV